MIPEDLAPDLEAAISNHVADTQRLHRPMCVARQVHPGADVGPLLGLLDDLHLGADTSQSDAHTQAGQPAADNKDPLRSHRRAVARAGRSWFETDAAISPATRSASRPTPFTWAEDTE